MQARLAALEDFREQVVAPLNAGPLWAAGAAPDPALALAHFSRFANPSLEPDAILSEVQTLADAVLQRAAAIAAQEASTVAAAIAASEAASPRAQHCSRGRGRAGVEFAANEAAWSSSPRASGPGGWGADSRRRAEAAAAARLGALRGVMVDAAFRSNAIDPWDPENTYIDRLLARRLGTPRSLALLWLAIARRAGLPLTPHTARGDGVLLKLQLPTGAGAVFADPTDPAAALLLQPDDADDGDDIIMPNNDIIMTDEEVEEYLNNHNNTSTTNNHNHSFSTASPDSFPASPSPHELLPDSASVGGGGCGGYGGTAPADRRFPGLRWRGQPVKLLGPAEAAELEPVSLKRLLGYAFMDVKRTYVLTGIMEEALGVIRYMRALDPFSAGDLRDEGLVLAALGRPHEAYAPLATYLEVVAGASPDAEAVRRALHQVEAAIRRAPPPLG
ncbi:hypothetical protein MNEG_5715 [Monoraphidium neglectum]|uniref:Protein SirB1 N-terminal domain-containing protein n=1 Tax=Monoraphidium neglectum TaxID=145388 RepID=A0A0D2JTL4_9CHLO|nr:hypothetical protein MNEG_5715 [Monoraphidium neglectum]KIZ02243.1 hypothetical protein MNEG_5715 [Monoraphidium neglectum]|eukprot:XP_013901262.1 hypothetical protein MNEG_5715 [Monoraphidium neglectum]